ncbi:tryptophan synthase subunit alpha [Micromonospora sp. WMMD734]|uniref:tryptophan synthase subunit alpha n=1 Tax=Micromonospora sp. WMMD734 TaxID=3404129 RepID=UPI003B9279D4
MGDPTGPQTRLSRTLSAARAQGRAALIGYLPVGFPTVAGSIAAMEAMVEAGVEVVEVGLPYSDPAMDGPVIQHAVDVALAGGTVTPHVFEAVEAVTAAGAAAVCMTYWNPVERYGVDRFAEELATAGGSGLIIPDLIPEEADRSGWTAASDAYQLDRIYLVAQTSTAGRLARTATASRGFVYAAALMGVTGTGGASAEAAQALVSRVRTVTDTPVCVGLGVSTGAQAARIAGYADGVIVGAGFVRRLIDNEDPGARLHAVRGFAGELATSIRDARVPA